MTEPTIMWAIKDPDDKMLGFTFRTTEQRAINDFVHNMHPGLLTNKYQNWESFEDKGYRTVKVEVREVAK